MAELQRQPSDVAALMPDTTYRLSEIFEIPSPTKGDFDSNSPTFSIQPTKGAAANTLTSFLPFSGHSQGS